MPATVVINRWTGASSAPTKTNITGSNTVANAEDNAFLGTTAANSTNPIRIPSAGTTNYSYWVVTRLNATVAPSGTINNIKWYSDGANSFGTGVTCNGREASSYIQAIGAQGTTGSLLNTTNYTTLSGTSVDVFSYTSAASASIGGSLVATTGDFGSFFVYQMNIGSSAQPGTTGQETFTWSYDET